MQISPVGMNQPFQQNTSGASAEAAASSASFDAMLSEAKRKAQDVNNAIESGDADAAAAKEDKALKEACKGFEAMFLNMMYKEMRNTVHSGGLFQEDNAMKIWKDMRDTELTKQMAEAGGIGLGDMLYKQLKTTEEAKARGQAQMVAKARGNLQE